MDILDRQYKENVRSIALGFVTDSFRARVAKGREVIRECLQRIGQEIELVTDNEEKHVEWFKQETGSDDAAKPPLRQIQQDLRPPPWRSDRFNLSVPLAVNLAGFTPLSQHTADTPEGTARPTPVPQDTPGPSSGTLSTTAETKSTNSASPPVSNTTTAAADKPGGRQQSYIGTPTGRSRKRKTLHGEPVETHGSLRSFESRASVQDSEIFGRAFAFEYPRGSGDFCIVQCNDCGWLCTMNPEKTPTAFENHWVISSFHRDVNFRVEKRQLRSWEILERHTYQVEGATHQWMTASNRQLMEEKNAAKSSGASQAPHDTPQTNPSTKSSFYRGGVKPRDKSYHGNFRGDTAKERYNLRLREYWSLEDGSTGEQFSSSSLLPPGFDDAEETITVGGREADKPDQESGREVTPDKTTPDGTEYARTAVRQVEDLPTTADFEKSLGDIKTEPGLNPRH